ncbi:hypothetical protein ABEB36_007221 [Hypothenemus hampei]|uniref:Gustatory receptor n=1 Tax=Hypothenemus hampei TaxID=57062 RepID=A0ABD1ET83_HYPHA
MFLLLQGFCLAMIGHQLTKQAKRTLDLCFELSFKVPKIFNIQDIQKEFIIVAYHVYQRRIQINATGFFIVDYSMIYFIFSNVCTYLIAVGQLFPYLNDL